ncbi:MAG: hypothetical protein ACTSWZ_02785 [Candidatus Heimdallarchaeaceae archaeon]
MSYITDRTFKSKQEAIAALILDRIFKHDPAMGGVFTEITGMQGIGKTGAMLTFLHDTIINYPKEKNFWRNPYNAPLQFTKLPSKNMWEILVEEGSQVQFFDRNTLEPIDLKYTTFKGFDDLFDKASPGKCTAVFFKDELTWVDFLHYQRSIGEFTHNYLDEYGELFPSNSRGLLWRKVYEAAEDLKEVRKCFIDVHTTTQSVVDVDWRVRGKIMIHIYFFGARPDKRSRVRQDAIDRLDVDPVRGNEAWLELGYGLFGKVRFTQIYKPNPKMNWEARLPDTAPRISDYLRKVK